MERVNLSFLQTGEFTMIGGCSVDVEDPNDWEEIERKALAQDFAEFLPTKVIQSNDEWSFDLMEVDEPDENN